MATRILMDGVETLKGLVGQELGVSEWKQLTYEDIHKFAEASGDFQWIHVDRERCRRESPYGVPIAHGYFSVARIGGLFSEVLQVRGVPMLVNYGMNKLRFPAPLKEGAHYRLSLKLEELQPQPKGVRAVMLATLEIQGEPKPACVAEALFLFMSE